MVWVWIGLSFCGCRTHTLILGTHGASRSRSRNRDQLTSSNQMCSCERVDRFWIKHGPDVVELQPGETYSYHANALRVSDEQQRMVWEVSGAVVLAEETDVGELHVRVEDDLFRPMKVHILRLCH